MSTNQKKAVPHIVPSSLQPIPHTHIVPSRLQPNGYALAQFLFGSSASNPEKPKSNPQELKQPTAKGSPMKVPRCSL